MSSFPRPSAGGRLVRSLAVAAIAAAGAVLPVSAATAGEAGTAVVGELVQAYAEDAHAGTEEGAHAPLSWVRTAAGETVRVPTEDVEGMPAGSTVSVDVGAPVHDEARAEGYEPAHEVLGTEVLDAPEPAALPASTLTNRVTVARAVPAGGEEDGVTVDRLASAIDGQVAPFWAQQTGGAVRLGVTAAHEGWIHTRAGCGDPNALWAEVARQAGFVPGPGRHLVVYVSSRPADLPGCSYALGQVGSGPGSGGSLYVRDTLPSVLAHELGHNLGLGYSSGLQCDGTVDTGACRVQGYRDYYDVMGASWSSVGALNATQAARLGVLPATAQVRLAPGAPAADYALAPLAGGTGTRAIELTAADGTSYWLEYRAAVGQDAWLATADNRFRLDAGVLVRRGGGLPDTSLLLDGTPGALGADDLQAALPLGVAVPLGGGAFTVTVQALTPAGATVTVTAAPAAAAAGRPAPVPAPVEVDVLPGRGLSAAPPAARDGAPAASAVPQGTTTPQDPTQPGETADPAARPELDEAADVSTPGSSPMPVALCAVTGCAVLLLAIAAARRRTGSGRARR